MYQGKPVTRIPIMAKQVLDLYELYRLVVQHGGLVEIINKKLWREITKGLNLPSSITSAAFTLRTQYQKFLYEYECEKEGLSNPADLQQAIDGNRREGRRSTSNDSALGPSASQQAAFVAAYRAEQIAALQAHQRQLEKAQRAAVEAVSRQTFHASVSGRESTSSVDSDGTPVKRPRRSSESKNDAVEENSSGVMHEQSTDRLFDAIPSAHLKITSRGGKRGILGTNSTKSSLVVSMEINGIMYQGVLFALNPTLQAVAQEDSASDPGDSSSIANSLKITL
uniref:ARID domain-containing protein n=1 Tax=Syphacia muris TaxID=451379 RepID=A0A0N5AQT9_9BILA